MHRRTKEEMASPNLQREIARRYLAGDSIRKLRVDFSCGTLTVRLALSAHGVEERKISREWVPTPEEIRQRKEEVRSRWSPSLECSKWERCNPDEWAVALGEATE